MASFGFDEKPLLLLLKATNKKAVNDLFETCFRYRHEGLSPQVVVVDCIFLLFSFLFVLRAF